MSTFLDKYGLLQFGQKIKEKITGKYCLYTGQRYSNKNSSLSTTVFPINLTKSCLGFKRIDIEAITNDHRRICFTIFDPIAGHCFILHNVYLASDSETNTGNSGMYYKNISCKISNDGMSITEAQYSGERSRGAAASASGFNHYYTIEITTIIGYTHY